MKQKIFLILVSLGLGTALYWFNRDIPRPTSSTSFASYSPIDDGSYCLAIRGNGELEPAHWGAMARTFEQLGLPRAMAGGSSGAISMLWVEAIASHPLVKNDNLKAALMVKSLLGYIGEIRQSTAWKDVEKLYGFYQEGKTAGWIKRVNMALNTDNIETFVSTLSEGVKLGVISDESIQPILKAVMLSDIMGARFYWNQLQETIKVFGRFDAVHDDNLFFRTGIVDFERLASSFGLLASFYAADGASESALEKWNRFFETCAPNSEGLSWSEIVKKQPLCAEQFHEIYIDYSAKSNFADKPVGSPIAAFPTTSVLKGAAAEQYRIASIEYHQKRDPHYGKSFRLHNSEDVKFGYWGPEDLLQKIDVSLDRTDEKSRRFMPLGMATWKEVLALSPAEPGLAPLKPFTAKGEKLVSAGGWSDLHPVTVLRAAGCENVVYLTRMGGESLFAQGIAKRLIGFDRDWSLLDVSNSNASKKNNEVNNAGDQNDHKSAWAKLYNLANPESSINRSLKAASAVLCTNWNSFDVKKDLVPLIEDAYHSSYWINPALHGANSALTPVLTETKPGCVPY